MGITQRIDFICNKCYMEGKAYVIFMSDDIELYFS
jgi:hypothetical protein